MFGLEAASSKSWALGFAFGPGAYLSTNWHRFDFTLVVLSVIFAPMGGTQVITVRLLRLFHSFAFAKYRNGRLVMKTVARALPLLGDVVLFLLWFLIVFAVSGVTLFGGKMTGRLFSRRRQVEDATAKALSDWHGERDLRRTDGGMERERDRGCGWDVSKRIQQHVQL